MASGKTHDIINLSAFPVFVYYLKPDSFIGFFAGYMIGTFFLSPDNDIFHSKPNKRWKFLRFIWKPYTKIFAHRGISHIPVVGILFKILYLSVVFIFLSAFILGLLFLASYFAGIKIEIPTKGVSQETLKGILLTPFSISFFVGLILAEIVHILTDVVYSFFKKAFRFS